MKHKQIKININETSIFVDEGLEDIISILNYWKIITSNSCIDNNSMIWIEFEQIKDVKSMLQISFNYHIKNIKDESFYFFLIENCNFEINFFNEVFNDLDDSLISTGIINYSIGMRFKKELLYIFKKLFFEVFEINIK